MGICTSRPAYNPLRLRFPTLTDRTRHLVFACCALLMSVGSIQKGVLAADVGTYLQNHAKPVGLTVLVDPPKTSQFVLPPESTGLVDILLSDKATVPEVRNSIAKVRQDGRVTVHSFDGQHLPYIENFVNLMVIGSESELLSQEIVRALAPRGRAIIRMESNEQILAELPHERLRNLPGFVRYQKPLPKGMDDWSHYLYDASNNAVSNDTLVGPPRRIQWMGGPHRTRHHDHIASLSALVACNGRLFYVNDAGSQRSIHLPPQWSLVARDAFNGGILWSKEIQHWVNPLWPLKSGPATTPRRLVADGERLYVTLGIDAAVSELNASTGEQTQVFPDTRWTRELVVCQGVLLCVCDLQDHSYDQYIPSHEKSPEEQRVVDQRWGTRSAQRNLVAIDLATGMPLWKLDAAVTDLSLAAGGGRVLFHDGVKIHAVDLRTGQDLWISEPTDRIIPRSPSYGINLIAMPEVVLFASGNRRMTAFSAADGQRLWKGDHPASGYRSPEDLFVVGDRVLSAGIRNIRTDGTFTIHELMTGELLPPFSADTLGHFPHHRCYRSKATQNYIIASRTGVELVDTTNGKWQNHFWTRGGCLVGLLPANGCIYTPPHHCACFAASKLEGFHALRPGPVTLPAAVAGESLETGPAYERLSRLRVDHEPTNSWPMYRHDAQRSGYLPLDVRPEWKKHWSAEIGGPLTSPVVANGSIVVAAIDQHAVFAFDAQTGRRKWRFLAGGRIDSPPTLFQQRVLFGCTDGYVYCLDIVQGELAWRFRAAPANQLHGANEQLESVWPVHGSLVIKDNLIHAVAGRSRFTDGGLHLLRIDPFTGAKVSRLIHDEHDRRTGHDTHRQFDRRSQTDEERSQNIRMTFQDAGITDLLIEEQGQLYMRTFPLEFDPEESTSERPPRRPQFRAPFGLLDPTWSHRIGRYKGRSPASRLLVFDDEQHVFGYGFQIRYQTLNTFNHFVYGRLLEPGKATALWPNQKTPFFVDAMAATRNLLLLAGPKDLGVLDHPDIYQKSRQPEFQGQLAQQQRVLAGEEGAILWAINKQTGQRLAHFQLDHLPRFDGVAVTQNYLVYTTVDGRVTCLVNR